MCNYFQVIELYDNEFKTKTEILDYLGKQLDFPHYYGCNLDAFNDCLAEVQTPTIIRIISDSNEIEVSWIKDIFEIAKEIAGWNSNIKVEHCCNSRFNPGDIVQHFKRETLDAEAFAQNNYLYRIIGVATHSETGEPMMVYKPLNEDQGMYVRPLALFCSEVDHEKYPYIKQRYRFEKVGY